MSGKLSNQIAWYEGKNQDALFYLLVAVFFIELIVGGISFFYGIIHAAPEVPGGPPIARFPWLAWALASILAPVALLLLVHLAGSILSKAITQQESDTDSANTDDLPEGMRRFYAMVRHAPTVVILLAILLAGAALFFMDGAFVILTQLLERILPYIPWLAVSLGALLAICFITHAIMLHRQRKLEHEYAWRREVLEKTGLVITDARTQPLSLDESKIMTLPASVSRPQLPGGTDILDVSASKASREESEGNDSEKQSEQG